MDKARVFTSKDASGKDVVLKFVAPSQKIIAKGDFIYRQHFSKSIIAGIVTSAQATKLLKENGIWTDEQENKANELRETIQKLEQKLQKPSLSNTQGKKLCDELGKVRDELNDLTSLFTSVTDNTAEQVAAEARNKYFASECVVYNDSGEKVFSGVDDFEDNLDQDLAIDSYREALLSGYERILGIELPSGVGAELPERKWLSDRGLLPGQEEKKETTKKKTRKKRTRKPKAASN